MNVTTMEGSNLLEGGDAPLGRPAKITLCDHVPRDQVDMRSKTVTLEQNPEL